VGSVKSSAAFDWTAKFGLPKEPPVPPAAKPGLVPAVPKAEAAVEAPESAKPVAEEKSKQKLICHACGTSVGYNVAKFCWFNKPKFGGNIYCMDYQKTVSAA